MSSNWWATASAATVPNRRQNDEQQLNKMSRWHAAMMDISSLYQFCRPRKNPCIQSMSAYSFSLCPLGFWSSSRRCTVGRRLFFLLWWCYWCAKSKRFDRHWNCVTNVSCLKYRCATHPSFFQHAYSMCAWRVEVSIWSFNCTVFFIRLYALMTSCNISAVLFFFVIKNRRCNVDIYDEVYVVVLAGTRSTNCGGFLLQRIHRSCRLKFWYWQSVGADWSVIKAFINQSKVTTAAYGDNIVTVLTAALDLIIIIIINKKSMKWLSWSPLLSVPHRQDTCRLCHPSSIAKWRPVLLRWSMRHEVPIKNPSIFRRNHKHR